MSGRRWGQIDGSRIQGGGVGGINSDRVRTARERRRDGRTDGRCERPILLRLCTLSMTRRTVTGKEKLLKAEPADKSHGRHSPTHLHSALCSSFQLFFGIFISPGSTQTHTHACARIHTQNGKPIWTFSSRVTRWRRTKWYLCSAVHICVGGATSPELHVSLR